MGQTMRVAAIAKALQRRGHEIRFIAAGKLIPIIEKLGIDVVEADDMPEFDYPSKEERETEDFMVRMQDMMGKIMKIETEIAQKEKPDMILSGTLSGAQAAKKLGIPAVMVFLQPHGQKTVNMFSSRMNDQSKGDSSIAKERISSMMEAASLIILEGMPEISGGIKFEDLGNGLAAKSNNISYCGPLLTLYPNQLPAREELKALHMGDRNKRMVYITIGGGSQLIGEQFLKIVLDALRMMPEITGVIATGVAISANVINKYEPPDNAIIRGFVPGTEMIRASDVTVFHGGSSTLMTCIACGTPAVIVPSIGEQEDNAAVLAQYSAGIVLDKETLTPGILAEAVQKIIGDTSYRAGAERLKALGEKYGGAEAAAAIVENIVSREVVFH